ncbi:MAG: L-histidine N(alpha)-methyltransferase [Deltaproteobacteria bacterium]|nr:L-histidine N(alpha)-methyltransferase [Deltaproteobacteria bacterium]
MTPPAEGGLEATSAVESAREAFRRDTLQGLAASPKRLAPKYFYDSHGSQLFDDICDLPEYYVTRAETSILRASASSIVARWGERVRVVEPGAGSGTKTKLVLEALGRERCVDYVPVDISREHLADAAHRIRADIPWLRVTPACADFCVDLPIPASSERASTVVYFPGSTIGNFDPPEATQLLARFRRAAGPGGAVVVGFDLKKTPAVLHAAYNDGQGVTAAFNKNLLARMNRELGARFDLDAFSHYAFYDPQHGRIEMHLVSTRRQEVVVSGTRFFFAEGESIHTECSYKYDLPSAERLARAAGLSLTDAWLDDERRFAVLELRPA